jgi:hypothetical protein
MEGQDGWGRVVVRLENALHQFKGNTASTKLLFRQGYQAIGGRHMGVIQFRADNEQPKRRRIKIAIAIDDQGNWVGRGSSQAEDDDSSIADLLEEELCELEGDAQQQYWLVVDVPLPATEVLAGQAVDEE